MYGYSNQIGPFETDVHYTFQNQSVPFGDQWAFIGFIGYLNVNFKTYWALLGTHETFIYVFLDNFETK